MRCDLIDLGLIDYLKAYHFQKYLVEEIKKGAAQNTIILCEHEPVITAGRSFKKENLLVQVEELKQRKISFYPVDRGGDVTFHGPGQLVIYPLIDLNKWVKDLHFFLRQLENLAVDFLKYFGISTEIKENLRGVWVKEKKIASLGIGVSRWITFHGLAININTDLAYFSLIRPCGLKVEMTSLKNNIAREVSMDEAKSQIMQSFKNIFNLDISEEVIYDQSNIAGIR